MKNSCRLFVVLFAVILLSPLQSWADKDQIYTRGWIGGQYQKAQDSFWARNFPPEQAGTIGVLPQAIKAEYHGGIFVAQVFVDTPAANAGLSAGELILRVDERKVPDLKTFYALIDAAEPGSHLNLLGFRDGKIVEHSLIVGRESYKKVGRFEIFLGFGSNLDIIPNPNFNIFSLLSFKRNKTRLELNAPAVRYYRDNLKSAGAKDRYLLQRSEGWNFRIIPFGVGRNIEVVNQEVL